MTASDAILQVRNRIFDVDRVVYPPSVDTSDIVAKSEYQALHTDLKYTDSQILAEVNYAVNSYSSDFTLATIPQVKEFIVITRAVISLLRGLAVREARNYKISVDGISISKSDRVTNYMSIAQSLEDSLTSTIQSSEFAEIEVSDAKRYNVRNDKVT